MAGDAIEMERVPDGTHARVTPLICRPDGGAPNVAAHVELELGFRRIGQQTLATIARSAERS